MSTPVLLVILIASSESRSLATSGIVRAVEETLGPSTTLRLETYDSPTELPRTSPPTSDERAYIVVAWDGSEHEQARLLWNPPRASKAIERVLHFSANDPEQERGRSVGYVIASIVARPEGPTPPPRALPPAMPVQKAAKDHATGEPAVYGFSLAASAAFPDSANSFGVFLDGTRAWSKRFDAGIFVEARFGSIPEAQASTRWLSAGVLGRAGLWSPSKRTRLSLALQVGATQLSITHLSEDDTVPDQKLTYLPKAELSLRLQHDLAQHTGIYLDLGAQGQAGEVTVNVHGRTAASIPVVDGLARVGVAARF